MRDVWYSSQKPLRFATAPCHGERGLTYCCYHVASCDPAPSVLTSHTQCIEIIPGRPHREGVTYASDVWCMTHHRDNPDTSETIALMQNTTATTDQSSLGRCLNPPGLFMITEKVSVTLNTSAERRGEYGHNPYSSGPMTINTIQSSHPANNARCTTGPMRMPKRPARSTTEMRIPRWTPFRY